TPRARATGRCAGRRRRRRRRPRPPRRSAPARGGRRERVSRPPARRGGDRRWTWGGRPTWSRGRAWRRVGPRGVTRARARRGRRAGGDGSPGRGVDVRGGREADADADDRRRATDGGGQLAADRRADARAEDGAANGRAPGDAVAGEHVGSGEGGGRERADDGS